jgi:hypothetical protein
MDGVNQPTINPNRMAKMGTPIPTPTAKRSRRIKASIGKRSLRDLTVDICFIGS